MPLREATGFATRALGSVLLAVTLGAGLPSAAGCAGDSEAIPFGPSEGQPRASRSQGTPGSSADSDSDSDEDAGVLPADDASECMVVSSGSLDRVLSSPADFVPRYATATWGSGCDDPLLILAFAEDDCADGTDAAGQQLQLEIRANAIGDLLLPGLNPISDLLLSSVRVRYRRPASTPPAGLWGTCPGVSGQIDVIRLDPSATGTITLDLSMELADCTDMLAAPQVLEGQVSVFLARDRTTACPER